MHILSPPWDRDARRAEFPIGFQTIDVPAMKLEVNRRLVFAVQDASLINELLIKLKWMLINRNSNVEIEQQLAELATAWDTDVASRATESTDAVLCVNR